MRKFTRGISLIEILVYTATLAMVVSIVCTFSLWLVKSQIKSKAVQEVSNNANSIMENILRETRAADKIYLGTSVFDSDSGQISLLVKSYLPEGETSSYLDFFLCDEKLCLKKEGQDPIALSSDTVEIKKFRISRLDESLEITIEASFKNPKNRPEKSANINLTSVVSLRSY